MPVSPNIKTAWERLQKVALNGSGDEVIHQMCPMCGGSLRIIFTPGKRTALGICCISCFAAVQLDGGFGAPPWVESLGREITTTS
jgi:hypothetical protein